MSNKWPALGALLLAYLQTDYRMDQAAKGRFTDKRSRLWEIAPALGREMYDIAARSLQHLELHEPVPVLDLGVCQVLVLQVLLEVQPGIGTYGTPTEIVSILRQCDPATWGSIGQQIVTQGSGIEGFRVLAGEDGRGVRGYEYDIFSEPRGRVHLPTIMRIIENDPSEETYFVHLQRANTR